MELRHLRHFVALAEEESFTRAAARELIVQSGLSSSVRALEREVGARLFVRGSRPVRLTAEGLALLPAARRTLEAADVARQTVQDVSGLLSGCLRIGTYPVSPRLLPLSEWYADFARAHPGLDVSLRQVGGAEMMRMVVNGELDCAVLDPMGEPPLGLRSLPLATEPVVAALCRDHPLARRSAVTLRDLAGERFVETDPSWTNRMRTDAAFAEAGLTRRIACEVADWRLLLDLVRGGLGVALVPVSNLDVHPDPDRPLRVLPVRGTDLERHVALVLPAADAASPAARRFASYLRERVAVKDT